MKVGDVVIPVGDAVLACGSGRYDCAIVACLAPFVLVSVDADMLWEDDIQPYDVRSLCQAAPEVVAKAVQRWQSRSPSHSPNITFKPCVEAPCHNCHQTIKFYSPDFNIPFTCPHCKAMGIIRPTQGVVYRLTDQSDVKVDIQSKG